MRAIDSKSRCGSFVAVATVASLAFGCSGGRVNRQSGDAGSQWDAGPLVDAQPIQDAASLDAPSPSDAMRIDSGVDAGGVCMPGELLCEGLCAACPTDEGTAATGCLGSSCVATNCDDGFTIVDGRCSAIAALAGYAYLKASNPDAEDGFGSRIALSADGHTLAIGAAAEESGATGIDGDESDNSAHDCGAVYVFRYSGSAWHQEAYLKASNAEAYDTFGWSLSLSADGNTLAVGAPGERGNATGINGDESNNDEWDSGAAYVFRFSETAWRQEAYIKASNTDWGHRFGSAVALSADANTLAVGAPDEASNAVGIDGNQLDTSARGAGAVYVFRYAGSTWGQQAYVKASNTDAWDGFGIALALSADGNTLAVGAKWEDSNAVGVGGDPFDNSAVASGAVYVFGYSGSAWTQQAYLKASNAEAGDTFGVSLALSADGETLAVGANRESSGATGVGGDPFDDSATRSGAAYVFRHSGSAWSQEAYVKASNTGAEDGFGTRVALSSDGNTLAVGAQGESSNATGIGGDELDNSALNSGAVYVLRRSASTWTQHAYVKASNTEAGDEFGVPLALSADGSELVAGAPLESSAAEGVGGDQFDNSAPMSGAAYVIAL